MNSWPGKPRHCWPSNVSEPGSRYSSARNWWWRSPLMASSDPPGTPEEWLCGLPERRGTDQTVTLALRTPCPAFGPCSVEGDLNQMIARLAALLHGAGIGLVGAHHPLGGFAQGATVGHVTGNECLTRTTSSATDDQPGGPYSPTVHRTIRGPLAALSRHQPSTDADGRRCREAAAWVAHRHQWNQHEVRTPPTLGCRAESVASNEW